MYANMYIYIYISLASAIYSCAHANIYRPIAPCNTRERTRASNIDCFETNLDSTFLFRSNSALADGKNEKSKSVLELMIGAAECSGSEMFQFIRHQASVSLRQPNTAAGRAGTMISARLLDFLLGAKIVQACLIELTVCRSLAGKRKPLSRKTISQPT